MSSTGQADTKVQPAEIAPVGEPVASNAIVAAPSTALAGSWQGHDRMLALLQSIIDRTDRENFYLGDDNVVKWRSQLASLPDDASAQKKIMGRMRLAEEEMRLGNEQEAIRLLQWVYERIPRFGNSMPKAIKNRVRYRLAVAYMRLGETQNCCLRNTPESCILPIRGAGIHTREEGSRTAMRYFQEVLVDAVPNSTIYRRAKWLLNIAAMTLGEYPQGVPEAYRIAPAVFESKVEIPAFDNVAAAMGLNSFDLSGGVVIDDFDNDGDLDIVTSTYDTAGNMHFFRNNADGTFTDRTEEAGLTGFTGGLNMVQADYNNDGHIDILVLRGAWWRAAGLHPNSLLQNQGNGTFRDVTFEAGLGEVHYPTQTASWADYDNDGDLDLYIGNEHLKQVTYRAPGQLFRNNGDETFTDVAREAGVENLRYAKSVTWGDYDNDRLPDLHVSNTGDPNRLYHNNGDGTFTDVAVALGTDKPILSFPAWFWHVDNDGVLDLYVSSYDAAEGLLAEVAASYQGQVYQFESPRLYRGDGKGGFVNVAEDFSLTQLVLPMGSNFGDLNGDGFLDFYLGTGYPDYEALMPNVMYLNQQGRSFVDVTSTGRFGHLQKGHGIAFADLDHDGDQDVFEQMGGGYPGDKFSNALYRNPGFNNHWLTLQLVGEQSNRSAIGARIHIVVVDPENEGQTRSIYKHVNSGGSFGASPLRQTIGLGKAEKIERLEIYWPTTDATQVFDAVSMDQAIRIHEGENEFVVTPYQAFAMPAATATAEQ